MPSSSAAALSLPASCSAKSVSSGSESGSCVTAHHHASRAYDLPAVAARGELLPRRVSRRTKVPRGLGRVVRGPDMYLERFYDDDLAQASYVIGSEAAGEAIVVDPRRDVHVYVEAARAKKLRIVAVTETHVHADFLSGARELAAVTDADL